MSDHDDYENPTIDVDLIPDVAGANVTFKDFVPATNDYYNCVKRPMTLVLSESTLAAMKDKTQRDDEAKQSTATVDHSDQKGDGDDEDKDNPVVPYSKEAAVILMSAFADGTQAAESTNGYNWRMSGITIPRCRYCRSVDDPDMLEKNYHYCKKCKRSHCPTCNTKLCNSTTDNVADVMEEVIDGKSNPLLRNELKHCHSSHRESWELRMATWNLYPGYKFDPEGRDCEGCHDAIDSKVGLYHNLNTCTFYCVSCAIGSATLMEEKALKKYDPLMTGDDYLVEYSELIPDAEERESRDGIGSLLNWVPLYLQSEPDFWEADQTRNQLIAVNCNPDSHMYNKVCILLQTDEGYDWHTIDDRSLAQVLVEVDNTLKSLFAYVHRDRLMFKMLYE